MGDTSHRRALRLAAASSLCVAALGGVAYYVASKSEPVRLEEIGPRAAWEVAQRFVRERLTETVREPVSFDGEPTQNAKDAVTAIGGGEFVARGWADQKNAHGVTVRTRFACKIRHVERDNWELVSLEPQ